MKEDIILAIKTILLPLLAFTFLFMLYTQFTARPVVEEHLKETLAQQAAQKEKDRKEALARKNVMFEAEEFKYNSIRK